MFELQAAIRALDNGRDNLAVLWLGVFMFDVRAAIVSGEVPPQEGQPLMDTAQVLIRTLRETGTITSR